MENDRIKQMVLLKAIAAKEASRSLASMNANQKNKVLSAMADALQQNTNEILFHNKIDIEAAKEAKTNSALIDRLTLTKERIDNMTKSIKDVIFLNDPIGAVLEESNPIVGLNVKKIRVPLGVISMIYEARPNVTVDAAGLCLKAGNAVILKGGSEAINSNKILAKIIHEAGLKAGMPPGSVQLMDTVDRTAVQEILKLDNFIDLIIPRGSEELINFVKNHSLIPILSHGKGLCHTYIDKDADVNMAIKISVNAKCQRPAACNAMETLLIHKDMARKILPNLCKLYSEANVELKGCNISKSIVDSIKSATKEDWNTEYHDLKLSIKVVNSLEEAISHINKYGSMHSEAIVTDNEQTANEFAAKVDAAAIFINASTRLHDGGTFGLGCEVGISTQKLHARGAMGINELTTTKYMVNGNGTTRS
ncbi:MAG: glutamate-5-semialdehyde dehydrogenase [Endomicrobium sp.]|jgi:glutamate-5-semialdehyde dehydrogenase|nr:glutamate-5-semialdehyde dehydrogenase [Endomicrobium sp.]